MWLKMILQIIILAVLLNVFEDSQAVLHLPSNVTISFEGLTAEVNLQDVDSDKNLTFLYLWDDGEVSVVPSYTNGGLFEREYTKFGYYGIAAVYFGEDTVEVVNKTEVYVGEPITGLSVQSKFTSGIFPVEYPPNDDVALLVTVKTGSDIKLQVTVFSPDSTELFTRSNLVDLNVTIPKSTFGKSGVYTVLLNASNPLTKAATAYAGIALQAKVNLLNFTCEPGSCSDNKINMFANVPVSLITEMTGEDTTVWWRIATAQQGSLYDYMFFCAGSAHRNHTFTITLNETGEYKFYFTASNHISSEKQEYDVQVYTPVDQLTISAENRISLMDKPLKVNIVWNYEEDSSAGGKLACEMLFGDGKEAKPDLHLSNKTHTLVYNYTEEVEHNMTVSCKLTFEKEMANNAEPEMTHYLYIIRENPVENLLLTHDSENTTFHPASKSVSFTVALNDTKVNPPLGGLTCTFKSQTTTFKTLSVISDVNENSNLVKSIELSPGDMDHTVSVNCSKRLTFQTLEDTEFYVYYDCWLSQFFDAAYRIETYPRVTPMNKRYEIRADVRLKEFNACKHPHELTWQLYNGTDHLLDIATPNTSTISFEENFFDAILYKFKLTSTFLGMDRPATWIDHTYVRFQAPDIQAVITDGLVSNPIRKALSSKIIYIDTSESYDPAGTTSLERSLSCRECPPSTTKDDISLYAISDVVPEDTVDCTFNVLKDPTKEGLYYISPNTLTVSQWYLFEVVIRSGSRQSTARQAILAYDQKTLHLAIECVSNCKDIGAHRHKLRRDSLQLNAVIRDSIDLKSVSYLWTLEKFDSITRLFEDITQSVEGPNKERSFTIGRETFDKYSLDSKYQVALSVDMVDRNDFAQTVTYEEYVMNLPPYNGKCHLEGNPDTVVAGVDDVCFWCADWLDEGESENRNASTDNGLSLSYVIVQRYLMPNKSIDTIYRESKLASSFNLRRCVRLNLPEDDNVHHTMVEVRVEDHLELPYAPQQFILKIKPPDGNNEAKGVQDLMKSSSKLLHDALLLGDTSTLFTTINALASVLPLSRNRVSSLKYNNVKAGNAGINEVKHDGTKLTESELMASIKQPEVLPVTTAVRNAKNALVEDLVKGESSLTVAAQTRPVVQQELISAATSIISGSQDTLDNNILGSAGKTVGKVIDRYDKIAEEYSDTAEFNDFTEELLHGVGELTNAIVDDDVKDYYGIKNEKQARDFTDDHFEMGSEEKHTALEDSDTSVAARAISNLKHQQEKEMKLKTRTSLREEQSNRIQDMLSQLTRSVPVSSGGSRQFGNTDNSPNTVKVTSVSSDSLSKTTVEGASLSLKLPDIDTEHEDVKIGLYEGQKVVNSDLSGRPSQINSKEVYLDIDMEGTDTFKGRINVEFQVEKPAFVTTVPSIEKNDADQLHRQNVYLTNNEDLVCMVIKPTDNSVKKYEILMTCDGKVNKKNYKVKGTLNANNNWKECFKGKQISDSSSGVCNLGVETVLRAGYTKPNRRKRSASNETDILYPPMNMTAVTMAFMLWDEDTQKWNSDKCSTTWDPDGGKLIGECLPQRKMTFANSFYVAPNRIDFDAVFLKFSPLSQAAVIATLAATFALYIILLLWARRADNEDLLKWGITSLSDNFAEDNYFYVIKVYTGLRPGAGTRSKIGIIVSGDETDTGQRQLSDGVRREFPTGSVINFLMATPVYLGSLDYIRIWHDNSGRGSSASWYLSKLEIQDVQRNETFSFLTERWLAIEKDDGLLECVVPVCNVETLNVFKNRFYKNAKETLAENHLWVSVVYRPLSSNFTRVQRVSCGLVFLMTTMITNAMFYKASENYESPTYAKVGFFRFELQQVYISLVCAIITTGATVIICCLFKLAKNKSPPVANTSKKSRREQRYKVAMAESWLEKKYNDSIELEKSLLTKGFPRFEGFHLPYWSAVVAWVLVAVSVLLSGFFLLLYSMEWGKQKSEEWLTTFFLSFIESVFFLDPVKVLVTALLYALIIRTEETPNALIDRQTIMKTYKLSQRGKSGGVRLPAPPLDKEALEKAREIKERDLRMKTALKDIIINVFIIWITFSISYSSRDRWSYHMHKETVDSLLKSYNPTHLSFYKVKTIHDYFNWLNDTVIGNMFPEYDISGKRLHWRLRQFLKDGSKIKVGPPRLRQVRTTPRKCYIPYIGEEICNQEYWDSTEETSDYCLGWKNLPCSPEEKVYRFSSDAWKFTSALDIWGLPVVGHYTTYSGGGYMTKLSVNREISQEIVKELYNNSWIDSKSRAVMFEFTLYCISTNIFTYNIFLAEFPVTGGVFPYAMILPFRLYMHVGSLGIYTLVCEITYLIYLVVITIMTAIALFQQKIGFFKKTWQVYDLVYIIFSYAAICMYFIRLVMTNKSMTVFREDKKEFVNFFHIALWDQMYVLLLGTLVFMATLRMLNVLGYNKRISAVARVFSNAASEIIWFGVFFLYVYICYAVFGYLLFGSTLTSYKDFFKAMETLFISMIGKSRFSEMEATDPIFSKVYFMIFILFIVYMILTMFLAVLANSIDQVHQDVKTSKADEMVEYVINKFKNMLTFNRQAPKRKSGPRLPRIARNKVGDLDLDSKFILEDIRATLVKDMTLDLFSVK